MADASGGAPLAIICGGGSFPGAVADAVAARGRRPVMFGIKGWAEPAVIGRYGHHWIALGQAGRFFRLAKAENCREVLFIGTVLRPPLTALRLDWHTIKLMPRVIRFFRGGDEDRKSTRLNSSHVEISYAVFCLKKKIKIHQWK